MANPAAANKATRGAAAVAQGTFVDGPKHTWKAIRTRPKRYGAMILGLGLAGAVAKLKGIDPEPYALAMSGGVWVWQVKKAWPQLRLKRGTERLRSIGANMVWPFGLMVGTGAVGHHVDHGHHAHGPATAGAQTVVITADIPTIVQHGMGHRRRAPD